MFGYIRPLTGEMKVSEYACYRAAYCGVCRAMKHTLGMTAPLALRYDFVFLALVRGFLTDEAFQTERSRCIVSPIKSRPMTAESPASLYAARCAGILTGYGIEDALRDEAGVKLLLYRLAKPSVKRWHRRALQNAGEVLSDADRETARQLSCLYALEDAEEPSPDTVAEPFALLLGTLFSCGLEDENARRIAKECGENVGRFIYLCDACDDAPEDEKNGLYNPLVIQAEKEKIPVTDYLSNEENAARLRCAMHMACSRAYNALLLSPYADRHPAFPLLENILKYGLPAVADHVLKNPGMPLPKDGGILRNEEKEFAKS